MNRWLSYLVWEAVPLWLLLLSLGFLSSYNWPYERRLFVPSPVHDLAYVGLLQLAVAVVFGLMASGLLWLMRIFWPRPGSQNRTLIIWLVLLPKALLVLMLVPLMLAIVWLGPAAIDMMERESRPQVGNSNFPTP